MPQPYPDPAFNTSLGLFQHVNEITSNWATVLVVMVIPLIVFIIMKKMLYRTSDSFLTAFFLGFLFSAFFWANGLLAGKIMVVFLLFTLASAIYAFMDD